MELQPLCALEAAMGCAIVSRRTLTPLTATMLRPRCAHPVAAMLLAIVSRRTLTPLTATMLRPRCALPVAAMLLAIVSR